MHCGFARSPVSTKHTLRTTLSKSCFPTALCKGLLGFPICSCGQSTLSVETSSVAMPRGVKKENLPFKTCVTCGRPFTWRKKWERVWDDVATCSKSCNRKRRASKQKGSRGSKNDEEKASFQTDVFPLDIKTEAQTVRYTRSDTSSASTDILDLTANEFVSSKLFEQNLCESEEEESDLNGVKGKGGAACECAPAESRNKDEAVMPIKLLKHEQEDLNMIDSDDDPISRQKAERKAAKKAKKAVRRAQREGRGDPSSGRKQCYMCGNSVDLLIRCTYDESGEWKMVCGKCWKVASGGVVDGDVEHPYYRYGGLWKNRRKQK